MQASKMSLNPATAEAGGFPGYQQEDSWWLVKWSSWIASIGAALVVFFGILSIPFNILNPLDEIAIAMQVFAAIVILAIEGSSVVSFLTFAKPIGMFFDGKPLYVKTCVYAALTILPMLLGGSIPCFILSAAITSMYAMILIGRKAHIDDMKAAAEQPNF